jgi:hypothetical protein
MDMDLVLTSVQLQHVALGGASSCLTARMFNKMNA